MEKARRAKGSIILSHTLTRRVLHRAHPVRLLEWNLLLAGIRRRSYLVQA